MYKSIKKITAIILAVSILMVFITMSIIATYAVQHENQVKVIVKNDVYSVEDGAPWEGVLVNEWVDIDDSSTMMSAVVDALTLNGYQQEGAEYNYISSINGLSAFDGGYMSGWMGTLNDWFTNQGFDAFTVADGTLESGDEICIMYTCLYGEDIGSSWGNSITSLDSLDFSTGMLSPEFNSDTTEYELTVPYDTTEILVTPTAVNKNYQVRTYLNEYTPDVDKTDYKRTSYIPVADGDKIIIGVGDSNWPSMNSNSESTVYTIKVAFEEEPKNDPVGKVHVTISNDVFAVENGAAWDGVLIDEWVDIYDNSTMTSAILSSLDNHGYSQKGAENNAFTEINGLATGDASYMSGWMGTLNDWFTNQGFSSYTVSDGTLENGDEIALVYTDAWGMDVGSYWDDNTTALAYLDFSEGELSEEFDPDITEYTLTIPKTVNSITVNPTAWNKNYQVRTYLNEYTPDKHGFKRSDVLNISNGDTIYIGVGEPEWPSMNYSNDGTVYTITVKYETAKYDVNLDGITSIDDATEIQKHLANFITLSDNAVAAADVNNDGYVDIDDVSELQKIILYANE